MKTSRWLLSVLFLALTVSTVNCDQPASEANAAFPQGIPASLKLIQMTGNIAGVPPLEGENMDWQEEIDFLPFNRFVKRRTLAGTEVELMADGVYEVEGSLKNNDLVIKLVYSAGSTLIASCSPPEEFLSVRGNSVQGSWAICDGPGLFYTWTKFLN
jgi:hypothetical protein